MVTAAIGHSATFTRSDDGTSGGTFATIGEVVSISPPALTREAVEKTHLTSVNRIRERIAGMRDLGEASVVINWEAGDSEVANLLADYASDTVGYYKITFPDATAWGFEALITGIEVSEVTPEGKQEASVTFQPTGGANAQSFITF